ncbi:MAG: rRNA maturation RNase YbeY [Crocinitomicaceae bacterium]|nr:rRNA maturation RNase YbeY [Crocinitomicaceae bacterium]
MIDIAYESTSDLNLSEETIGTWISKVIELENFEMSDITLVFCNDEFLLKVNQDHLDHDFYTDIITFDYCSDGLVSGDLFISVERVIENAKYFSVTFEQELHRVIIHGILHLCGYLDKTPEEELVMREKESEALLLL